ncbi:glutathione S-transferase A-like [Lethenteron reissneri]|uniref:glutathione S-transferase A-like n=1 Tax=Lethenteron reissneri TaxID=7753 RepID=UPI002AB6B6E3|nr:glutathione S-transferase A-like [Lethenteron reissneri]
MLIYLTTVPQQMEVPLAEEAIAESTLRGVEESSISRRHRGCSPQQLIFIRLDLFLRWRPCIDPRQESKSRAKPGSKLPSFRHGVNIINESLGACFYLENQFKAQGTKLMPDGAAEQALVLQRTFEVLTLQQKSGDVIYYNWRIPVQERHNSALKRNTEALAKELLLWEGYLAKMGPGSYIAGKAFTIADAAFFPTLAYCFRFGLSAERYPNLGAYYKLLEQRPSVQASWPPHWKENPQTQDLLKEI